MALRGGLSLSHSARRPFRWIAVAFGIALVSGASQAQPSITLVQVATGLPLPVAITNAGDGSGRLFITQQGGQIVILVGGQILQTPFLNISSLISFGGEQGLLSVAFDPNYVNNGYFYVYYTDNSQPTYNIVVSRYTVSSSDPNQGDPNSAQIVITIPHPTNTNHNGGQLQFGPDGYLYLGTGDGGSGGDPPNNAQNLTVLLGKILRIDINASGTGPCGQSNPVQYGIPASNPFAGSPPDCPEIWAYGVRNPWRFSFDRSTGDLLIGDVGQNCFEEVDFQPAGSPGGQNYGWRIMEGLHCFNPDFTCNPVLCDETGLTLPILEYAHGPNDSIGCAITGGYRYRATPLQFPQLYGYYLYGDYCSGRIWGATQDCSGNWTTMQLLQSPYNITTFGEDETGEIYVNDYGGGSIFHVTTTPNYPLPATSGISPSFAIVGGPGFTLTVNGTSFFPASVVRWNGSDRATTYDCANQLTASIPASDIAMVGTASVTVFNPAPGGGPSNDQTFTIENYGVPTTTGISPSSAIVGGPGLTLTVDGTGFFPASVVRWNGSDRTTTYVSANQLTASIPASDISAVGSATVTVFNPAPGGGLSNGQTFNTNTTFLDVSISYWAYADIEAIFNAGITVGCGGGNYCPEGTVTRAQMAVFLLKAEHGSSFVPPACSGIFRDVACMPTPAFAVDWIEQLSIEGITAGCGGGNYCPGEPVTRAQMAVFLLRAEHGSSFLPPACAGIFQDVECMPTPAFAVDWIEQLHLEGVTGGCSASPLLYCPDNPNTRAQMAVFLVKTFGLPLP